MMPKCFMRAALMSLLTAIVGSDGVAKVAAQAPLSVWFQPAGHSRDIDDLFRRPDKWRQSRALVNAFGFGEGQLRRAAPGRPSLLPGLLAVDAFRKVGNWGLDTVLGVPALKEWDCTTHQTAAQTIRMMQIVYKAGGKVQFLDMDEPLISALGLNRPVCHLNIDQAAGEIAAYTHSVLADRDVLASGLAPRFFDTEAYPSLSVQQIETWLKALARNGAKPAGFNLDANVNAIDINPPAKARLAADLQELQRFLANQGVTFGIIIWSGYDPVRSSKEYYDHAMNWTRTIHAAIGRPDRVIFSSWVTRCSLTGDCHGPRRGCSSSDPDDCGSVSVPRNLPENDPRVFSHTRLIIDAIAVLTGH